MSTTKTADVTELLRQSAERLAEIEQERKDLQHHIEALKEDNVALIDENSRLRSTLTEPAWAFAVITAEEGRLVSIGNEMCVFPLVVNKNAEEIARINARLLALREAPPMRVVKLVAIDV